MASESEQEKRETIAEVVADMRKSGALMPAAYMRDLLNYADRIEAAWKRERDELIYAYDPTKAGKGRLPDGSAYALEAMRHKLDPNWAETCAKCKDGEIEPHNCEYYGEPNGCNSPTYGEHPPVGDVAALREALITIRQQLHTLDIYGEIAKEAYPTIVGRIDAALSAPARNCDLPLVVDGPADNNADKAWIVFKRHNPDAYFDVSGLLRCIDWLLAPAAERKGEGDGR